MLQSEVGSQVARAGAGVVLTTSQCTPDTLTDQLLHVVIEEPR